MGYLVVSFEVASSNSFRDIPKIHFVTAAETDIDDSIKRKRFRVSHAGLPSRSVWGKTTLTKLSKCGILDLMSVFKQNSKILDISNTIAHILLKMAFPSLSKSSF